MQLIERMWAPAAAARPLALGFLLLLGHASRGQQMEARETTQKFTTLLNTINQLYVDSVDMPGLVESAIVAMLEEMDPHSVYIPAEELKEADEPLNGNFEGIGVQFNIFKDTIMVVNPIPGGPSERLGIMAGDRIVTVDGENVAGIGITNDDVMKKLKGPKGTRVVVGILRDGESDLLEYEIIRDVIPIFSVDAAFLVAPKIGYIKVNRFAKTTMGELHAALDTLRLLGMKDLILDLQGNGGGMLRTATEMADEFLAGDKLLVYTEGRAFPREDTYGSVAGTFEKGRLVVLIDQGSASASEIVAGAIQDWDRGLIMGRRSFGKGLVQRPINLPDGSAVRLTVQKYFTPSGRCIQKPYDEGVQAYREERLRRFETGELLTLDSLHLPGDSLTYYTLVKKRKVYGAGGIIPDIFVPLDTTGNSEYFSRILRKGLDNRWAILYVDSLRASLEAKFPTEDAFVASFKLSAQDLMNFQAFAAAEEVEFVEADWTVSGDEIALRLKAMIGRNLHAQSTFYRVIAGLNETLTRAIEVLQDGTYEKSGLAK